MLDLSRKDELVVVKLGDAEITCKPHRSQDHTIAKLKASKSVIALKKQRAEELEQGVETKLPNMDDEDVVTGVFTCVFNTEFAKLVILEWKGVGIAGEEIPVNDENIELLMADGALQEQFFIQYMELQRQVEEEKKSL